MKSFGLCFGFSLLLHILFFPSLMSSMMTDHQNTGVKEKPERVKIRLVKRPKPAPKVVSKPKPKPKVAALVPKPKPQPKVKPKPKPKTQPKPQIKPPVAKKPPRPRAKPKTRKPKPAVKKPKSYPKRKPSVGQSKVPKARTSKARNKPKISRTKRLSTTGKSGSRSQAKVATSNSESGFARPGEAPGSVAWEPPGDAGDPTGTESQVPEPVAASEPAVPAKPERSASRPLPPKPPEPPKPRERPKPPPKERPDPPPVAKAQKARISVPTIEPPAKFRKKKLKGKLKVRFKVAADGTFEVSLSDSSGNPEFDDYVLAELRKVAKVEPAIGKDGKPRRSVLRRPVKIKID